MVSDLGLKVLVPLIPHLDPSKDPLRALWAGIPMTAGDPKEPSSGDPIATAPESLPGKQGFPNYVPLCSLYYLPLSSPFKEP